MATRGQIGALCVEVTPNHPVNTDARASVVPRIGWGARAGYWER
jgi:hypothetical protein